MTKTISIQGAREHNLKNINVKIPREKLTIITGLSGSGKSSLAFDTIYAEGQRRYVESLSTYARQFLQMMQKPNVDLIEGLSPAISIEQKTTSKNPRSTVGTVTEVYDYLRLLFARIGIPYSPVTGLPIKSQTVTQIVDRIKERTERSKLLILAPIIRGRKGEHKKELSELQKKGFQRIKIDGEQYEFESLPNIDKKKKHDIEVVVDRISLTNDIGNRLADSVETALNLGDGLLIIEDHGQNGTKAKQELFSSKFACPVSGFTIDEIEPRLFSFNNPYGACPECDGIGTDLSIDPNLIFFGHTYETRDWVPRLSARLNIPLISDCIALELLEHPNNGTSVVVDRPVYQAKLNQKIGITSSKAIISFQAGSFSIEHISSGNCSINSFSVNLSNVPNIIKPEEKFSETSGGVDLTSAELIVSVGRGIGKEENIPMIKSLATKLNAQIGSSRPVVDAGWLDHSRQIGSSGQTVSPKLYLALGISGAIQHVVGMKGSKNIVVINKDSNAPIFEIADYGVVGDLFEIVPKLIAAIQDN